MPNARLLLALLICATPLVLFWDGLIVQGVISGVTAIGLVLIAGTLRPGETAFFLSIARPAAVLLAIPTAFIILQLLPLGILAHPIWKSAEAATGHRLTESISIDIGGGVLALGRYVTVVAIGFWSAAVAVDRQRAEWIQFALVIATGVMGVLVLLTPLDDANILGAKSASLEHMQAVNCISLGIIFALTGLLRTIERFETRRSSPDRSSKQLALAFILTAATVGVCVSALAVHAPKGAMIAAAYGAVTIAALVTVRRLGLGSWAVAGFAVAAVLLAAFLAANEPALRTKGIALAFADQAPPALVAMSQRILDDTPLLGVGAGAFSAIAPIYRDVNANTLPAYAPTTFATLAIELGRPALWLIILAAIGALIFLLRAALQRGRDSFYPIGGAAILITLALQSVMNAGSLGTATAILAAASFGLALAQSKSRTARQQ